MSQEEELVAVSELVSQSSSGGEGEAQALSGSPLVEKQECFSFPRQRSTSDEMAVHCVDAKGGGDQALPSLSLQRQYQSDWQAKLEELKSRHKQESLQQQKEHLEQLRILQAQILTELTVKSTHQPSSSSVPTSPVTAKEDALQPKAPLSPKPRQSLPTSPLSLDKREATREESEDLTHTRSLSNPQLTTVAMCTLSATLRSATPSPVEASSPNHTPVPSHWLVRSPPSCTKSPPQSPSQGGDIGQIQQEPRPDRPGEFSKGSSFGFLQPGPESTNTSTALVRTSTTESLEQNSQSYDDTTVATCTSLEVSPIKGDEQIETSEGDASPDRSLSNLNVPKVSPSSGKGGMSDTVSPPTRRKLAWTEPTSQQSSVITSLSPPSRNLVVKTSPVPRYLVTPTPHYPVGQLSPRYCSPYNDNSIRPSPGNAGITVATPTAALSRGRGCASPNTTITESQSRALLMEKHRKHMDDLKTYYESELSQLHSRLEQLEAERNDPSFTSTTARRNLSPHSPSSPSSQKSPNSPRKAVHQLYFPSSLIKSSRARTPSSGGGPSDGSSIAGGGEVTPAPPAMAAVVNESELWMLQNENARLKSECAELHGQVDVGERERHALEEQVKRMQNHNVDCKERLEASERMVSVLQERLEVTRSQLYDQDKLLGQLRSDLQVAAEELRYWKEQRSQDIEKIEQLFDEFEVLQQENQGVRSANSQLQYELEEAQRNTITYKASLDKYQALELQYKSTIHELEDEVRHLQHVNNRLHSMGTHYQLGSYGSPFNQPDEEKVHVSPRSSSKSRLTHPPSTPQLAVAHERGDTPSSAKVPLTRRKWLESSVPGLIFGGGEEDSATTKEQSANDSAHSAQRALATIATSPSRVPAMVNLSLGVKESKSRSQLSISPSGHGSPHPTGDRSSLSQQKSPSMKAVQKVVLVEDSTGQDPGYSQRWYEGSGNGGSDQVDLADSALKAVREGSVTATDDGGYFNPENRKKRAAKTKQLSIEDRVKKHMQTVSDAEQKLAALQKEKEKLESGLLKTPRVGSRTTRQTKQTKLEAERRLEEVIKEIGSVRMVLRRHHALKK